MKEETKRWMKRAERDLMTSKHNIKSKDYYAASFWCQQAVEKALKAVILEKKGELVKIHDLVELGKKAEIKEESLKLLERLTYVYTDARYPDTGSNRYSKRESEDDLKIAKEVVLWVKKKV